MAQGNAAGRYAEGATLRDVTAKRKLLKRVAEFTEAEASDALRLLDTHKSDGGDDPWGDLDAWTDATAGDAMEMLDREEAATGFSWQRDRR